MNKKQKGLLLLLLFASSCTSQMGVRQTAVNQRALEEARNALLDVKQALAQQQLEIQLLEERLDGRKPDMTYNPNTSRIENLETTQRRILEDLKKLGTHANETSLALTQFKKSIQSLEKEILAQSNRLNEVVKLKSTLSSISDAIGQSARVHKVRSGDSLDKIARKYNTSVQSIKQANGLSSNTILIGQELKIP